MLAQAGVDVSLVVSDDASTDATRSHLEERAASDPRITILPQRDGTPGVTGNFLHLFTTHVPDGSFVAFTDQDDVWHEDKLSSQLALMASTGADVVSSNVTAFESLPGGGVGNVASFVSLSRCAHGTFCLKPPDPALRTCFRLTRIVCWPR